MQDLISRQALCDYALNQKDKSVTPNDIMRFPSAQPEITEEDVREWCYKRCLTIIDNALYLEMRSRWLPSAQPDLSEYSDKLWRNAYERGKRDAQPEIIRCKDCKYYREYGYVNGTSKFLPKCTFNSIYVNADDFCSRSVLYAVW